MYIRLGRGREKGKKKRKSQRRGTGSARAQPWRGMDISIGVCMYGKINTGWLLACRAGMRRGDRLIHCVYLVLWVYCGEDARYIGRRGWLYGTVQWMVLPCWDEDHGGYILLFCMETACRPQVPRPGTFLPRGSWSLALGPTATLGLYGTGTVR